MTADNEEQEPENCDQLRTAVAKTGDKEHGRQQVLIKKAIELGCVDTIPESWEVEISD